MEQIGLTEAITALREELSCAVAAATTESLKFEVGTVMMEFEVAIERERSAKGGLNIWVITLGGEGSRTQTQTHRLTLPLTPVKDDGKPVLTGESYIPN